MTVEADDLLEWNQTEGIYTATGNAVAVQGTRMHPRRRSCCAL